MLAERALDSRLRVGCHGRRWHERFDPAASTRLLAANAALL
jgi:hypothetical protein